jgi:CarD family transcriptional regulator
MPMPGIARRVVPSDAPDRPPQRRWSSPGHRRQTHRGPRELMAAGQETPFMAYSVGDTVIYPHHGAAVVERKEERELKGESREYLVLRLTYGDLTLMVPADSCEEVGIRNVVSKKEVEQVLDVLREPEGKAAGNWSRRFKANYEKLRSGDIYQVAEVVRNLATREKDKGLSAGEKRMLTKAKQILLSELAVAIKKDEERAEQLVEETLAAAQA